MHFNDFSKSTIALIALFIGVFSLSFGSILVKFGSQELSSDALVFNRMWLAVIVFGAGNGCTIAYRRFQHKLIKPAPYTVKTLSLLLIAGVLWAATLASLFWALTQTSVAIAVALHNLVPLFTSLAAWLFLGQKFNRVFILGMVIAILGVGVIELEELQISASRVQGDVAAILSAIFMAAYLLIVERLRNQFSVLTIQTWVCGISAIAVLPLLLLSHQQIFPHSLNSWLTVFALIVAGQVLGHGLLTFSLAHLSSVIVSLVHLLDAVFGSFLAWAILSEQLSLGGWIGFVLVLCGLYLSISNQTENLVHPELEIW